MRLGALLAAGAGKRRGATVVALNAAAGKQGVVTVILCVGSNEFEFADLVATQCAAGEIVAFYPQAVTMPPAIAGAVQWLQRGWESGQAVPSGVIDHAPGPAGIIR